MITAWCLCNARLKPYWYAVSLTLSLEHFGSCIGLRQLSYQPWSIRSSVLSTVLCHWNAAYIWLYASIAYHPLWCKSLQIYSSPRYIALVIDRWNRIISWFFIGMFAANRETCLSISILAHRPSRRRKIVVDRSRRWCWLTSIVRLIWNCSIMELHFWPVYQRKNWPAWKCCTIVRGSFR